jgi:hypothetical protein
MKWVSSHVFTIMHILYTTIYAHIIHNYCARIIPQQRKRRKAEGRVEEEGG